MRVYRCEVSRGLGPRHCAASVACRMFLTPCASNLRLKLTGVSSSELHDFTSSCSSKCLGGHVGRGCASVTRIFWQIRLLLQTSSTIILFARQLGPRRHITTARLVACRPAPAYMWKCIFQMGRLGTWVTIAIIDYMKSFALAVSVLTSANNMHTPVHWLATHSHLKHACASLSYDANRESHTCVHASDCVATARSLYLNAYAITSPSYVM